MHGADDSLMFTGQAVPNYGLYMLYEKLDTVSCRREAKKRPVPLQPLAQTEIETSEVHPWLLHHLRGRSGLSVALLQVQVVQLQQPGLQQTMFFQHLSIPYYVCCIRSRCICPA